jgi:tyrosinase
VRTEVTLNGSTDTRARYVGWAPVPAQVRLADPAGAAGPVAVRLGNQRTTQGGQLLFSAAAGPWQAELRLTLPLSGAPIAFSVAGQWSRPSIQDGDAVIEASRVTDGQVLGLTPVMVRIRKDAESLTVAERNRFRSAFATLNNRGFGRYSDFRNVHSSAGDPEAHGRAGFLPWHRVFLLDLERELQRIDPSVALPYWRFDRPAPRLFSADFMGVADPVTGAVRFSGDNPLQFWATDGVPGVVRRPRFNPRTQAAGTLDELSTIWLGGPGDLFELFRRMEANPHGTAHTSFTGFISSIPTAARDPLFFLLHANVDRLWAKWQWARRRVNPLDPAAYSRQGSAASPGATRIGHNLLDTMWPWNEVTTNPRPPVAPGGTLAPSPLTAAPGLRPTVGSMIDYQGVLTPADPLGFDYDDVPPLDP